MTIHKKGKECDYEKKRTIAHIIVILVALVLLAIILVVAVKKSNQTEKSVTKSDPEPLVIEESIQEDNDSSFESDSEGVKKFQDKYSMDWGFVDAQYLLKIAEYHGGTKEERAYTILVTLNKVFEERRSIQDIVLEELYNNDGLESDDFEKIVVSDATKEALKMIVYDRFDNSAGSTEYKEFYN